MARVIQEHVKRPLAEELLFGRLAGGGTVRVTLDEKEDRLALVCRAAREPELIG
jgi:ATP-dependent Clp protease ATP-binding subunit ClpA